VIARVNELTEPLVHEPRRAATAAGASLGSQRNVRAISSGVSPLTAIGEMKLSKSVEVRFWNRIVFSTATS
jgi:hypothetical protein